MTLVQLYLKVLLIHLKVINHIKNTSNQFETKYKKKKKNLNPNLETAMEGNQMVMANLLRKLCPLIGYPVMIKAYKS